MKHLLLTASLAPLVVAVSVGAEPPTLTVKLAEADVPKEVAAAIRSQLDPKAIHVHDGGGKLLAIIWRCKELSLPADAAEKVQSGVSYNALPEGLLVGVLRVVEPWSDYRKQKVKPGVYTLRFARQPMDGDHMGTAPYNEFLLLVPAAMDQEAGLMAVEDLHDFSGKSVGRKHPSMMLLFPNRKPLDGVAVTPRPQEHVTVDFAVAVTAGTARQTLGFGLTIIGHTMAE